MKESTNLGIFEVDMAGFQAVQSYYFSRSSLPMLSITKSNLQFNLPAVEALQNCESIKMFVNKETQQILVQPSHSRSQDSIRWTAPDAKTNKPPKLECGFFVKRLFELWDWNTEYRYKTAGRLVHSDKQVMLMFDFNSCEVWDGYTQVKGLSSEAFMKAKADGKKE